jgi:prevent-host-death family protein
MMQAKTSALRAKLSRYLRAVRNGEQVLVKDRDTPIARLVPYSEARAEDAAWLWRAKDPAAPALGEAVIRGIRYAGTDSLALLEQDRRSR